MKKNDLRKITSKKPVVIELKEITTQEKMDIIKEYYVWVSDHGQEANAIFSYIEYERYLKKLEKEGSK